MQTKKLIPVFLGGLFALPISAQENTVKPIVQRVDIQSAVAPDEAIINGEWVAVGTKKKHAIGLDYNLMFKGKPSYHFELKEDDNTLSGYKKGETKGRAELAYCYATDDDVKNLTPEQLANAIKAKKVYHFGKGACPQGSTVEYEFSVYIPGNLSKDVTTIFAQWHGMPDRTLLKTPEGVIKQVSDEEFARIWEKVIFNKDTGYDKVAVKDENGNHKVDKNGEPVYKAAKNPNGWMIEQGGYPPLAFGFSQGYFYIKANSDRKWMTDKSDRCNIEPLKGEVMVPRTSEYKASTLAYKEPFEDFPKDTWVSFKLKIDWSLYGGEKETIIKPGKLDVIMNYEKNGKKTERHIVDNQKVLIGRNDKDGYYFKFGIYRVGDSTVPVSYNLAGYKQKIIK